MKSTTKSTSWPPEAYLGVDLGDRKHHVCVTDKQGTIVNEFSITNDRAALKKLCEDHPNAAVTLEVGAHSPWI